VIALQVLAVAVGLWIVVATVASSLKTTVLPRGVPARIARWVFRSVRWAFGLWIGKNASYARRDRVMAYYGPVALLVLLVVWLTAIGFGFFLIYWGVGVPDLQRAFFLSGSSIFTLGFERPAHSWIAFLSMAEAALGLVLLALLITYLPSIYQAFSRREALVTALEVRAGNPPAGATMLIRFTVLGRLESLSDEIWSRWEDWFVDIEESHTSFPSLSFFRSPTPDRSWVAAAGAVLDAAALYSSTLDVERDVKADICIRAGYVALRRICDFFGIRYDPDPQPGDPVSISRKEFDMVCERFAEVGIPLKADVDQAWRDFAGWRVNYDTPLLALASLTDAPPVPWSSDRVTGNYRDLLAQAHDARRRQRPDGAPHD
jgi:hypothetical protein